jgi:hypothetical protein
MSRKGRSEQVKEADGMLDMIDTSSGDEKAVFGTDAKQYRVSRASFPVLSTSERISWRKAKRFDRMSDKVLIFG